MKIIKIAAAALLVLVVAALAGVGRPDAAGGASDDTRDGITVTGTGRVQAVPNRADLSFGVQTEGATAAEALSANSAQVRRVIAALKDAGAKAKQLKTEYLSVSPAYENGRPTSRYSADASISVSDLDLEAAARLTDIGVKAGADSVSGPSLAVGDRDAEYRRALDRAFDDARAKAEALAAAARASVGSVTAIVEGAQPYGGPVYATAERAADAKAPIEPGSEEVTAVVTVTFALGG
jgi:uncharacterized protein